MYHQLAKDAREREYYRSIDTPETQQLASVYRRAVRACTGSIPWWAIPKPVKKPDSKSSTTRSTK